MPFLWLILLGCLTHEAGGSCRYKKHYVSKGRLFKKKNAVESISDSHATFFIVMEKMVLQMLYRDIKSNDWNSSTTETVSVNNVHTQYCSRF